MRRICYISGTRADFRLMSKTLHLIDQQPDLDLSICVTGMHLLRTFGYTAQEVIDSKLRICGSVPVTLEKTVGYDMAIALGEQIIGMTKILKEEDPHIIMLLGDRGEVIAAALSALHLNIPIVHIHGGERSGTIDESIRHAASKLSHYHFVATETSRQRLIRMGERESNIFVTGAPGLDDLFEKSTISREALCAEVDFDPSRNIALVIFHPIVQTAEESGQEMQVLLEAIFSSQLQAVCIFPNADAGNFFIREVIEKYKDKKDIKIFPSLQAERYVSWMAAVDIMVGNSSSGIIEAASFGLPVVNIGARQNKRERNANVIDVEVNMDDIMEAINKGLNMPRKKENLYGDGNACHRIVELLSRLPLNQELLLKCNEY